MENPSSFLSGRENYPVRWNENDNYHWGQAQVIRTGGDVALVGCGCLFSKAQEAATLLDQEGIKATVINNPFINRVDTETIGQAVQQCGGRVVTIEDHQIIGGMGAQLSHALNREGITHHLVSLGIDGQFGQSAYVAEHLYRKHGLTAEGMAQAAKRLLAS